MNSFIKFILDNLIYIIPIVISITVPLAMYLSARGQNIRIQEENLKMQLFEKRYKLYETLREMFLDIVNKRDWDDMQKFYLLRDEVYFLFGQDIHEYVVTAINNIGKIKLIRDAKGDDLGCPEMKWFLEQTEKKKIRDKFAKYLGLNNYGVENEK